jgi:hypothetical protein
MRLEQAVPLLLDYLGDETDLDMADSAATALRRIGGEAVVREIDARWWQGDVAFRRSAACILDHLRGDLCVERSLAFFRDEEDRETKSILADALLSNFAEAGVDLVRKFAADIDEGDLEPDERDLRYRLVVVATIMGRKFPMFDEWQEAALQDNWGRFSMTTGRVAENIQPDQFGPKWSMN